MLKKDILELLNREVDNANTEKDRIAVGKIVQKNAEARRYLQEMQEVSSLLRKAVDQPAPPHLKERILRAIPLQAPAVQPRISPRSSFWNELFVGPRFRLAYTFAGGAAAGILLFVLLTGAPSDSADLAGTMASKEPSVLAHSTATVTLKEANGAVEATRFKSTVVAGVNLQTPGEVDLLLNFDPNQLTFDSFHPLNGASGTFVVLEDQLRLTLNGNQHYEISFTPKSESLSPMTVRVFARGILLSEYDLSLETSTNN